MIEKDPALTLQQLSERTQQTFGVHDSKSTVHNYLERRLITLEKVHAIPATMNNDANKELRRQYVERISQYMRDGKTIICMDETNINLFCRRTRGQARAGDRAAMALPASMGPNVHVVCTVSLYQMIHTTRRRGDFKVDSAEASVLEMLENLQPRVRVACVVLVCDNFPCHLCENDNMGLICLSFGTVLPNVEPCGDNLEQSESNEFKQ